MSSSALTTSNIILAIVAFLSLAVAVLQFASDRRATLYAKLHGYPHYHLFDFEDSLREERETILKYSLFGQSVAEHVRISGVYRVLISNEGESAANDVNVSIRSGVGVMVLRSGKREIIEGDSAALGDIKPSEKLELIAWTKHSAKLYSRSFGDPQITITYANGLVQLKRMYEIDGALRFIHEHNLHIFFVILLWIIFALVCVKMLKSGDNSKQKSTVKSKDDSECETEYDGTRS